MKNILKITLIALGLLIFKDLQGQNCLFSTNDPINWEIRGNNQDTDYTQAFALTNTSGEILMIHSVASFPPQEAGTYSIYSINHADTSTISSYSVGNNINQLLGSCLDTSSIAFKVCMPTNTIGCHSKNGTVTVQHSGFNTNSGFKQTYILTDENNLIIRIASSFNNPLFTNISPGNYLIYALNYEETSTISGLEVGNYKRNITGNCLAISEGFPYVVCLDNTNCNAPNGEIHLSNNNYHMNPDFQQAYVLTNENGIILAINQQANSNQPVFSDLNTGRYNVYAINYNKIEGLSNFQIGKSFNSVSGTCMDKKGPLIFQVCEEICDNGIDDDNNGKIDCADDTCLIPCPCGIAVTLSPAVYNDQNTPMDITDDTFSFEANIIGEGAIGWQGGGQTGVYGTTAFFGPYSVDSSGVGFQIQDRINATCFTSISVNISSCVYLKTCTCCSASKE